MSNSVKNVLNRLLSQYTFNIDSESTFEDLTCLICKKLMADAYQACCGCQYCHDCIVAYLAEGERHCCGGKTECDDEYLVLDSNVHKSAMLNKKILKVKVICPNESCSYRDELVKMDDHLRICNKQSIECPYLSIGCDNARDSTSAILTHLLNDPLRHTQLMIEYIHGLKNEFEQLKKTMKEDLQSKELQINEQRIYIEKQNKNTEEHRRDIDHLIEENRRNEVFSQTRIQELMEEITSLKRDNESIRAESRSIKNTMSTLDGQCRNNKSEMEKIKSTTKEEMVKRAKTKDDAWKRMDKLEATIGRINKGTNTVVAIGAIMFAVNRFSVRKTSKDYLCSPYFYTHSNGYKLRLEVYPGGNGNDTHLSVYRVICKGEYDDLLEWPCKYGFTMSIINQINKETLFAFTLSHSTADNKTKCLYNKPTNSDNIGEGYPTFISHADLHSINGLIVKNCVIVKCVVQPPL